MCENAANVALETLDSIDTIMLKIFYDVNDTLYLKYDTSLDFTTPEIDWMAKRMDELIARI